MTSLLDICFTEKKSELRSSCKRVSVSEAELADFIIECECKMHPWLHKIAFREFVPEHLHIVQQDFTEPHDDRRDADQGGRSSPAWLMLARVAMLKAMHHGRERVFSDRKETHWGKRKFERDQ